MSEEPDRIDAIDHVVDHAAIAIGSLPRLLRNKTLFAGLVRSYLNRIQEAENMLWDLLTEETIDAGEGVALDRIGQLIDLPRATAALGDAPYRHLIKGMVRARRSSGTGPDLIDTARTTLGSAAFTLTLGRTSALLEPHGPLGYDGSMLFRVMNTAKLAGVQMQVIDPPTAEGDLFTCALGALCESDSPRGFSDTTEVAGGEFTGVAG